MSLPWGRRIRRSSVSAMVMSAAESKWSRVEPEKTASNEPSGNGSFRTSAVTAVSSGKRAAAEATMTGERSMPVR